jgi:hypothetical protein
MCHFATSETDGYLDFVPRGEEFARVPHLGFKSCVSIFSDRRISLISTVF